MRIACEQLDQATDRLSRAADRELVPLRDSFFRVETLDALAARDAETLTLRAHNTGRQALVRQHAEIRHRILEEERVADEVAVTLSEA